MPAVKAPFVEGYNPLENALVAETIAIARQRGVGAFLVGGYIRDLILCAYKKEEIRAHDLDFAISGMPAMAFSQLLADQMNGRYVPLDEENDTARVVLTDGTTLDFAGCVGGTIDRDVQRRDFTVNALAWCPDTPDQIIDNVDGLTDLFDLKIRAVSEAVLIEDPLRLLRAFRFSATLGAPIEKQTLDWIKTHKEKLIGIAAERINHEFFTLLDSVRAGDLLVQLGECGLLEIIFPEMVAMRKVTTNAYHHLGLFDHSVEAVRQLEMKVSDIPWWVLESAANPLSFGISRMAATKLATLLHDIGKPDTWEINEDGRHTFYGHDTLGAQMSEETAERMKWPNTVAKFITKLIAWHLRPGQLFHQGPPTDKAVRRFYRRCGADLPELMLLAYGDLGATRGDGLPEESRVHLSDCLTDLLAGYPTYLEETKGKERLLDGKDVMMLLSIKPGPLVGEILDALDEAQDLREVADRPAAERFVMEYKSKKYSS